MRDTKTFLGFIELQALIVLCATMVGCAEQKHVVIPRRCIQKVEVSKPCEPEPDGVHADCQIRVTYTCVKYQ